MLSLHIFIGGYVISCIFSSVILLIICYMSSYVSVLSSLCLTNSCSGLLGHVMNIISGFHIVYPPLIYTLNG